jgi:lipopolysaccharide transport system permease protein
MTELSPPQLQVGFGQRQPLLNISADRGWSQRFCLAAQDTSEGLKLWRLAWALGVADIKLRYRGSMLGPFWLTLSFAIMVGAMGFLYAELFQTDVHSYLPYLTTSLLLWNYMSALVTDGCMCFTQSESLIKGARMPFTVHALRSVIRNTIVLAHNVIVVVGLFLIMQVHVSMYLLAFVPGFLLWLVDGFAISLLLGAFCARFRDVPQIVASVMQIAFFLTPIMWYANLLENHSRERLLIDLNPFYYLIQIVRAPLLGISLPVDVIVGALAVSVGIILLSAVGFMRSRGRIAYWV